MTAVSALRLEMMARPDVEVSLYNCRSFQKINLGVACLVVSRRWIFTLHKFLRRARIF